MNLAAAQSALKLGFFVSILTVASLGARLATANISPDAESRALGISAARLIGPDLSDAALRRIYQNRDADLFARHDPGLRAAGPADLLTRYEQGPPLDRWDLPPATAEEVNASVPIASAPNPAARPFIFRGSPSDHEAAVTCLTQAVYYEAGFEPVEGAQAVAQVVLNRVRHPIFPKTVCGVVYQGADLKTGCQFSFTCDGSMNRPPAAAAWARAETVARKALDGFVQKEVGEATHYHTQFVFPWWAPTVSKVAKVGVQIFYRWPGDLGMPPAFSGRYAGDEHVGRQPFQNAAPADPSAATELASSEAAGDGRLHAILAVTAPTVIEAPAMAQPAPPPPVEVAVVKSDTPDLKAGHVLRTPSPFVTQQTQFACTAMPCQHW